jgi:hypothetical protein
MPPLVLDDAPEDLRYTLQFLMMPFRVLKNGRQHFAFSGIVDLGEKAGIAVDDILLDPHPAGQVLINRVEVPRFDIVFHLHRLLEALDFSNDALPGHDV